MTRTSSRDVIVVAAGGIIGLSTAYHLARRRDSDPSLPEIKIKVIEVLDRTCAGASSTNTALIHDEIFGELGASLTPLPNYSVKLWEEAAKRPQFWKLADYRPRSCFIHEHGIGESLDGFADLVGASEFGYWDTESALGTRMAMSYPRVVGEWLRARCLELGVEIQENVMVVGVDLSPDNRVQAVACLRKSGGEQTITHIKAHRVVLACGAYTPSMFRQLFPSSTIRLEGTTDAEDWVEWKNSCPTRMSKKAFVSFDLAGEMFDFAKRDNNGSIWACARTSLAGSLPPLGQVGQQDPDLTDELHDIAQETIPDWKCRCNANEVGDNGPVVHVDDLKIWDSGRAFRSAFRSGLPVISQVSPSSLGNSRRLGGPEMYYPSGLFVCWGHGSHSLTLGMGSGKLMSQLVTGETPDMDLSLFTLE